MPARSSRPSSTKARVYPATVQAYSHGALIAAFRLSEAETSARMAATSSSARFIPDAPLVGQLVKTMYRFRVVA